MCVRFLAALACTVICLASAQVPQPATPTRLVSLQECISLALSRNLDLQIEYLNRDVARFQLSGAYGAFVPTFSFEARHDFVSTPGDYDPDKFNPHFPLELNTDSLGPKLSGELPVGLSYEFSALAREDNARTDFRSDPGDARNFSDGIRRTNNYFATTGVSLQQHLLKDFWIDQERQTVLLRRKDVKISAAVLRFQLMKTVLAVELSYDDLLAARERVRVQEKALELRQQLVNETRRRVEVGDLPPLDREQAETQLENTLTALSAAREAWVTQQNVLKNLLTDNFRQWADLELAPEDALVAVPAHLNRAESALRALEGRPDLQAARLAVEKSDAAVKFRLNQLFPNLDLVGGYGSVGVDPDSGSAVNQAFSFGYPNYYYGVVLSFPVTDIAGRANYRSSQTSRRLAELQLRKAEQEVMLQIADFVNRATSRFDQAGSTRKARGYAEAALAAEQKKLQNGFSTSFFVLQLQETLTEARTAEVEALVDYNKALAQLAFAEGSILDRNHVTVEIK